MLSLDDAAPDSCRAELPLHIPMHISTFGIYSSHGSRENVRIYRPTDKPMVSRLYNQSIDAHIPARMRIRSRSIWLVTRLDQDQEGSGCYIAILEKSPDEVHLYNYVLFLILRMLTN